jgi:hypothetical protein
VFLILCIISFLGVSLVICEISFLYHAWFNFMTKFQFINNMHCIVCALCSSDVMIVHLVCSTV